MNRLQDKACIVTGARSGIDSRTAEVFVAEGGRVEFTVAQHGRIDRLFDDAGGIATGIFGRAAGLPPEKAQASAEAVKGALATTQAVPRAGVTDEVARAAVFPASDDSTFVNGHDLVVDGGLIGGQRWSVQQQSLAAMGGASEST